MVTGFLGDSPIHDKRPRGAAYVSVIGGGIPARFAERISINHKIAGESKKPEKKLQSQRQQLAGAEYEDGMVTFAV